MTEIDFAAFDSDNHYYEAPDADVYKRQVPARSARNAARQWITGTWRARAAVRTRAMFGMTAVSAAASANSGMVLRSPITARCTSMVSTAVWLGETSSLRTTLIPSV